MTGSRPRIAVSAALSRPGIAAIRDLGRGGFDVVGADFRPTPLGLHSRWSPAYLQLPPPDALEPLLDVLRAAGARAILPIESRLVAALCCHRRRVLEVLDA